MNLNPLSIPDFIPFCFQEAFFAHDLSSIEKAKRNELFHQLFLPDDDPLHPNEMLSECLVSKSKKGNYGFLANSNIQHGKNWINPNIVTYIFYSLYANNAESFYNYLHKFDKLMNDRSQPYHKVMENNLTTLFSGNYDKIIGTLHNFAEQQDDKGKMGAVVGDYRAENVIAYFKYVKALYEQKHGSYAYALVVLFAVLNVYAAYFIPYISQIIIYEKEPTNQFDEYQRYIIKSAMHDNLFLSVLNTFEPLSDGEGFNTKREMLFSVDAGKFHTGSSLFCFVKASVLDNRDPNNVPIEDKDGDSVLDEKEVKKVLNKLQKLFKKDIPDLASTLLPKKTEPYYIKVGDKYLTYGSWFSQSRATLKEQREKRSKWSFTTDPNIVAIYNKGQFLNMFAMDIPNGAQTIPTVMWCFPSFSQAAQRFSIHQVIEWRKPDNAEFKGSFIG